MKIIDSHTHLGGSRFTTLDVSESTLLENMDRNGVDASLVLPFPAAYEMRQSHDRIAAFARKHPGRAYGVACVDPHLNLRDYFAEVRRCVDDLGFVAIKLHPMAQACPINSPLADKVFAAAEELGVPLLIHSGLGVPESLPGMFLRRAAAHPDLRIVMCHAGAYIFTEEAILVAEARSNIWLETSWCAPHRIREAIDVLGPGRVMMGADTPESLADQLAKYRSLRLTEEVHAQVLGGTAMRVFGIESL